MSLIPNVDYRFVRNHIPRGLPKVNWADPITRSLVFLFGSDPYGMDIINGVPAQPISSAPLALSGPRAPTAPCRGLQYYANTATNSTYLDYGTHRGTVDLAVSPTGTTWAFYYCLNNIHNTSCLMSRNDNNAAAGAGWLVGFAGSSFKVDCWFERVTANTKAQSTTGIPTSGGYHTLVVTTPGDRVAGNVKFYFDGVLVGTSIVAAGSGASGSDTAQTLKMGFGGATLYGANQYNGGIQIAAIARRVWNGPDIAKFARTPFILFANEYQQYRVSGIAAVVFRQSQQWIST